MEMQTNYILDCRRSKCGCLLVRNISV